MDQWIGGSRTTIRKWAGITLASYPDQVGGERRPGIDCLHMHAQSFPEKTGNPFMYVLEIVGKIALFIVFCHFIHYQ